LDENKAILIVTGKPFAATFCSYLQLFWPTTSKLFALWHNLHQILVDFLHKRLITLNPELTFSTEKAPRGNSNAFSFSEILFEVKIEFCRTGTSSVFKAWVTQPTALHIL